MKYFGALALCACGLASAAEVTIPDACDEQICMTDLRWKKVDCRAYPNRVYCSQTVSHQLGGDCIYLFRPETPGRLVD